MSDLIAQVEALEDAAEMVADWGGYASEYFQLKHDLAGDIAKLRAKADALRTEAAAQPPVEPVAWRITKGGNRWIELHDVFVSRSYDYGQFEPLYTHPDPRLAEYRELLVDSLKGIKVLRTVLDVAGLAGVDVAGQLIERIEAALKEG